MIYTGDIKMDKNKLVTCSSCYKALSEDEFYKDTSKASGRKSQCKTCVKKKIKDRKKKKIKKSERNVLDNSGEIVLRKCTSCHEMLGPEMFSQRKDSLAYDCKSCEKEKRKIRYRKEKITEEDSVNAQKEKLASALQALAQMRSGIRKCGECEIWRDEALFRKRVSTISGVSNKCVYCIKKEKNGEAQDEHPDIFLKIKKESDLRMERIMKKTLRKKGIIK